MEKSFKTFVFGMVFAFILSFNSLSYAQLVVDPTKKAETGSSEVGGAFSIFEIDVDAGLLKYEWKDKLVGAYYAYGLNKMFDLYGFGAYYTDSEGFALGAGTRVFIAEMGMFETLAFGQLYYFTGEDEKYNFDFDGYELSLGLTNNWKLSDALKVYGILQITPISDFETDVRIYGIRYGVDVERDDLVVIRAGATYQLGPSWSFRGEATFIGEKAFTIGVSRSF